MSYFPQLAAGFGQLLEGLAGGRTLVLGHAPSASSVMSDPTEIASARSLR